MLCSYALLLPVAIDLKSGVDDSMDNVLIVFGEMGRRYIITSFLFQFCIQILTAPIPIRCACTFWFRGQSLEER